MWIYLFNLINNFFESQVVVCITYNNYIYSNIDVLFHRKHVKLLSALSITTIIEFQIQINIVQQDNYMLLNLLL